MVTARQGGLFDRYQNGSDATGGGQRQHPAPSAAQGTDEAVFTPAALGVSEQTELDLAGHPAHRTLGHIVDETLFETGRSTGTCRCRHPVSVGSPVRARLRAEPGEARCATCGSGGRDPHERGGRGSLRTRPAKDGRPEEPIRRVVSQGSPTERFLRRPAVARCAGRFRSTAAMKLPGATFSPWARVDTGRHPRPISERAHRTGEGGGVHVVAGDALGPGDRPHQSSGGGGAGNVGLSFQRDSRRRQGGEQKATASAGPGGGCAVHPHRSATAPHATSFDSSPAIWLATSGPACASGMPATRRAGSPYWKVHPAAIARKPTTSTTQRRRFARTGRDVPGP